MAGYSLLALSGGTRYKPMQRGFAVIDPGETTVQVPITSVNITKAKLNYLGFATSENNVAATPRIHFISSTMVEAFRSLTTGSSSVSFEVVEWY